MDCPYCTSAVPEAALVCTVCRRDLYVIKRLLQRIAELEAGQARGPALAATVPENPALPPTAPPPVGAFEVARGRALFAWSAPLLMLLLAHGLLVFVYDARVLYLRLLALVLPLPFGFLFGKAAGWRLRWSLPAAFLMAGVAVLGMSTTTAWVDKVPVLPQTMPEVRELIEFATSIAFSFVTGLWLHDWLRRRAGLAQALPGMADSGRMTASLTRLNDAGSAVVGVATTAFSIYTGLKGFLGG